jgi:hypothetical protein
MGAMKLPKFVQAFIIVPAIGGQHFIQGHKPCFVKLTPPPGNRGKSTRRKDELTNYR